MNTRRIIGVGLTGIGLLIAVVVGVWLAIRPDTLATDSQAILVPAVIAFVLVFVLMILGLYFVLTTQSEPHTEPEMETPLAVMDKLKGRSEVRFSDLAREMALPLDAVQLAVREMTTLQIFSGYINDDRGVLSVVDASIVRDMTQCAVCHAPLHIDKKLTMCKTCQTHYYLI